MSDPQKPVAQWEHFKNWAHLRPFQEGTLSYRSWRKNIEPLLKARVPEDTKKAIILSLIGDREYEKMVQCYYVDLPIHEMLDCLESDYEIVENRDEELAVFFKTRRNSGENIENYVERIYDIAVQLWENDVVGKNIFDQVFRGVKNREFVREAKLSGLQTVDELVELARVYDAPKTHSVLATRQSENLERQGYVEGASSPSCNWRKPYREQGYIPLPYDHDPRACWTCGQRGHLSFNCRYGEVSNDAHGFNKGKWQQPISRVNVVRQEYHNDKREYNNYDNYDREYNDCNREYGHHVKEDGYANPYRAPKKSRACENGMLGHKWDSDPHESGYSEGSECSEGGSFQHSFQDSGVVKAMNQPRMFRY